MGGRRWAVIALVALLVSSGLVLVALLTRSQNSDSTAEGPSGGVSAPDRTDAPSSVSPQGAPTRPEVSASPELNSLNPGGPDSGGAGPPNAPGSSPSGGSPPSPPPQPPPSPPSRPSPIPCTVSVYSGPIPGVPNIRIVVTADPNVDMVWATVSEGARSLRGAIALAGGRGEQIVDGVSQRARVIVYSSASMAEPTQSCSNVTD